MSNFLDILCTDSEIDKDTGNHTYLPTLLVAVMKECLAQTIIFTIVFELEDCSSSFNT